MLRSLYKLFPFFILSLILLVSAVSAVPGELTVIASSESQFHFTFNPAPDLSNLERLYGEDSTTLFVKTVQIGLPYGSEARLVSVAGSELGPVGGQVAATGELSSAERPLASISSPLNIRGRRVVSIYVAPVVGNSVYGEVEVRVVFDHGLATGEGLPVNDPYFDRIFKSSLANFDQFRLWPGEPRPAAKPTVLTEGIFSQGGDWVQIHVNRTGLHQITGGQLQQAGLSGADLASGDIRMFNAGGLPLEFPNENPRPEFREVALKVEDGGDGVLDGGDRILFYGEALNRWLYQAGTLTRFVTNPYAEQNVYWLTAGGDFAGEANRMELRDVSVTGLADTTVAVVVRRAHAEEDHLLFREADGHKLDFYNWYWTDSSLLSVYIPTPGAVTGEPASVILRGATGGPDYMDLWVNSVVGANKVCNSASCSFTTDALVDGLNEVYLVLAPNGGRSPFFDYMNIEYSGRLVPEDDQLDFAVYAPVADYRAEVHIVDEFSSEPIVLDISDPRAPVELTGFSRNSGLVSFEDDIVNGALNRFYSSTPAAAFSPASMELVTPTDLRLPSAQTDIIVIAARPFVSALAEWEAYREAQGYAISIVTVDDIMDNFAYGPYDPTAIRDFLNYAYENYPAPAPSAVLFVGDANYDFRNILQTDVPNYVPACIHPLLSRDKSYSDDNYVYFGTYGILDSDTSFVKVPDRGLDMICSRWPVTSAAEIDMIVDKIRSYESVSNFGRWRSKVTLVADDEYSGSGSFDGSLHTLQADTLEMFHVPAVFNREKIYLWEYPLVNREKPAVNEKIVQSLNAGCLLINYVGHGNPDVWAHEHVFQRATDLPKLTNTDRLPLVFAASCAIGTFDDPEREGMAENFLNLTSGGAIGVISATRLVYSTDNAYLNRLVFDVLFDQKELSIAEALYTAKLLRQWRGDSTFFPVQNDRAFNFLGDPCLRLGIPRLDVIFTDYPDSLVALGRSQIAGYVVDTDGDTLRQDGRLIVTVFDTDREKSHRMENDVVVTYDVEGPTIFGGSATIQSGKFDFEFITPLDVGFGGQGARIAVYAILDSADAAGLVEGIAISDSITISSDSVGPVIAYNFSGRQNFISGDAITSRETLTISLSDSSGINLAGGLGHGIFLEMDGMTEKTIVLNDYFEYEQDDYTTGSLSYVLEDISPGMHAFKIKAWDNANNSSTVSFSAEAVADGALAINDLMNYPNPMADETTFYFELTHAVERFSLDIFTVSGRKIKSFNRFGLSADNYPNDSYGVVWDGRDATGDRVATGVYIYKATALPASGAAGVESFGKIVVIN